MTEQWKSIVGYEGLYEVSNWGRVRSLGRWTNNKNGLRFVKGRILKLYKDKDGYLVVGLCKDCKQRTFKVHRLVAQAFIPNPDGLPCVNHKDQNPANNIVNNLEWCTVEYNNRYLDRGDKVSKANTNGKRSKSVYQCTPDGELVNTWPSAHECERNGFNQGAVAACCRGVKKSYKGFLWSYNPPSQFQ